MRIDKGRHPLLDSRDCVPVDFESAGRTARDTVRGVVITGPNTGGKTVTLKLVGLFSVMAQCGLHLPCDGAEICMNGAVLCDIGDRQDIAQNLSTFSAHITNVIEILNHAAPDTLVLLDELGSGTDPAEGMGIAVSILEAPAAARLPVSRGDALRGGKTVCRAVAGRSQRAHDLQPRNAAPGVPPRHR